jgi:hypothetical protein
MALKLITETVFSDVSVISEATEKSGQKTLYIEGPFMQAEIKNKNGRIYPFEVIKEEVERYNKEKIDTKMSLGELCHTSSTSVNPERVCHLIQSLKMNDDGVVMGRSKILSTPMGAIVRSLIEEGVKLGVSSRGLGTMQEGTSIVNEDFHLVCIDVVTEPSAPDCFVNGILENKEYIIENNIIMEAAVYNFKKQIDKSASRENVIDALDKFFKKLKGEL